jgi:hypothetical protein
LRELALMRAICNRYNGASLKTGDQVIIAWTSKRKIVDVCHITVGQRGRELASLDLGEEEKEKFRDIFEEYSLLRIEDRLQTPLLALISFSRARFVVKFFPR